MMRNQNDKLKWSSLIMGTLLLITAIIIFSHPVKNFYALTWLIGVFIVINGILGLFFRRAAKVMTGSGTLTTFMAIIDIIFGLLVMFNVGVGSAFFIYMFAVWFVISSVIGLMTLSGQGRFKGLSILINMLGLLFGIILLFNPMMGMVIVSMMIGISFTIIGVMYIVDGLA
ncbi:DUF308 domain-containing protein [Staphylococcus lugdunensis]|nr:DUF308 domain-containing protein [Staphylococcus lugdunensis]ARJ08125.1 hypothetical protein B7454_01660 [Staphylococcus lugdunensis]EKS22730.1 hypothetical protein HMPREF9308_01714 [Staphylococcus lugdunensis ACS-027-V-Sch2]MCH8677957.1 DUF308 domain-containing protein [Staphylococcus lugdunensis]MCI2759839.1 DUF308 domain-containing protein [Staphylococcus lugdunensis]MCI2764374.1 DUF308 domain-containing protein [Staphylococcus lugdunensis]